LFTEKAWMACWVSSSTSIAAQRTCHSDIVSLPWRWDSSTAPCKRCTKAMRRSEVSHNEDRIAHPFPDFRLSRLSRRELVLVLVLVLVSVRFELPASYCIPLH
jgi:hypothetical protein